MDREDKVSTLLSNIKEQIEELLGTEGTEEMSAVELIILATEIVISIPVTTIEYTQPIGIVDREKVTFMLDDEFDVPLFTEEYYEEE